MYLYFKENKFTWVLFSNVMPLCFHLEQKYSFIISHFLKNDYYSITPISSRNIFFAFKKIFKPLLILKRWHCHLFYWVNISKVQKIKCSIAEAVYKITLNDVKQYILTIQIPQIWLAHTITNICIILDIKIIYAICRIYKLCIIYRNKIYCFLWASFYIVFF